MATSPPAGADGSTPCATVGGGGELTLSLFPNTLEVELRGVSGGVVIETPVTLVPTLGIAPIVDTGLLTTTIGDGELPAFTELAEEDRAGLAGGRPPVDSGAGESGGGGCWIEMGEGADLWEPGVEVGFKLGVAEVGVGVVAGGGGRARGGPVYFSPSSPGEKMTTLQKPSVEVIRRVRPSADLGQLLSQFEHVPKEEAYHVKSVNAA